MFTNSIMKKYTELTKDEQTILDDFTQNIADSTPESLKKSSDALESCTAETIFKLSEKSASFKYFCETNISHLKVWQQVLRAAKYPGIEVKSQTGSPGCTTYNQFIASYLFDEFQEMEDSHSPAACFLLDKACENRFLFALVERCNQNLEVLKNDKASQQESAIAINQLEADIESLCNLYWGVGYGFSCKMYLNLGKFYGKIHEEGYGVLSETYYLKAVEKFCCAEVLTKNELSQQITNFLVGEGNYFEYTLGMPFKNWKSAKESYILKFLANNEILYSQLHKDASSRFENTQKNTPDNA
jgi:hypothetical protein